MNIVKGKVIKGQSRGKSLGFPTANLKLNQDIPAGIYISQTKFEEKVYPSLTFIGKALTFDETKIQAETCLLDVNLDLYNKQIEVELIDKIRDNQKFESEQDLIKAMKSDEQKARDFFDRFPLSRE